MKTYRNHPLAELYPTITNEEQDALTGDIQKNGLHNPIWIHEGKILDGRHRYIACVMGDVKPIFKEYEGKDPVGFVISQNDKRRHLNESQRALIAAKLSGLNSGHCSISQREAAKKMSVSRDSVNKATKVISDATKKTVKEIELGEKTINKAFEEIKEKEESKKELFDETEWPIPESLVPMWNRGDEVREMLSSLRKLKMVINKAQKDDDIFYRGFVFQACLAFLTNSENQIKTLIPHAVCHGCNGENSKKCTKCHGKGWMSELSWGQAGDEIKDLRIKMAKRKK